MYTPLVDFPRPSPVCSICFGDRAPGLKVASIVDGNFDPPELLLYLRNSIGNTRFAGDV
ncbi:hypothetical protein MAP00_007641 [Monascus purpureus]|nr:hypothetical protein MAP00_007641 [Monascus purpureus]